MYLATIIYLQLPISSQLFVRFMLWFLRSGFWLSVCVMKSATKNRNLRAAARKWIFRCTPSGFLYVNKKLATFLDFNGKPSEDQPLPSEEQPQPSEEQPQPSKDQPQPFDLGICQRCGERPVEVEFCPLGQAEELICWDCACLDP